MRKFTLTSRLTAVAAFSVLAPLALLPGCATYISVPGDAEDLASNSVNTYPTGNIIANSLAHTIARYPVPAGQPIRVSVAQGANEDTMSRITRALPAGVEVHSEATYDPATQYRVMSVYKRGTRAWANILVPEAATGRFVNEVALRFSVDGWRVEGSRRWFPGNVPPSDIHALSVDLGPAPNYSDRQVPDWSPPPLPEWGTPDPATAGAGGLDPNAVPAEQTQSPPAQQPTKQEEPPKPQPVEEPLK